MSFDREAHRVRGVMVAVFTPMKSGGMELDLSKVKPYVDHLASIGVFHVMLAGSTGESVSLTAQERMQLAEEWSKHAPSRGVKVYTHVGGDSLLQTIELARHSASLPGISGLITMCPVFFKASAESLIEYLVAVSEAVPTTPLWYYHIPCKTGVLQGRAHEVLQLASSSERLPTLVGAKFTDTDLQDFAACLAVPGYKYNMLFGEDSMALSGLRLGADGVVSSTVNYSPTLREVVRLFLAGDAQAGEALQRKNAELCALFEPYGPRAKNVQKRIMRMVALDVGPPRLPYLDLGDEELADLRRRLQALDCLDPAQPAAAL